MTSIGTPLFVVLLLLVLLGAEAVGTCPHCHGNFVSCDWASKKVCCTQEVVKDNATIVAAGVGALTLAGIIKPRFLKMFSRVAFDTILSLINRQEPGTSFELTADTKTSKILDAIRNGLTNLETVLFKLCGFIDEEENADKRTALKTRLECLKAAADIQAKLPGAGGSLSDSGIFSFIYAKVSEFVARKEMQIKLTAECKSATSLASELSAKVVRPEDMMGFAENLNLFAMFIHGLGVASFLVVADFLEHVVFDTIRRRGFSWKVAHELMLVMFRLVEDSGGRLTLGTVYQEVYLNSAIEEAKLNEQAFFRTPGGSPGNVNDKKDVKFNGKFTSTGFPCKYFNEGIAHPAHMLKGDGTCKGNHVCDHWVKNKGKNGKCLCSEGTPGHPRNKCDNPNKGDRVTA